jgi:hypothetical protein
MIFNDDFYAAEDDREAEYGRADRDEENAIEAIAYFIAQKPTRMQEYDACTAMCSFFWAALRSDEDIPF